MQPYQGLSIDFSFSSTQSKDTNRRNNYIGLNGETAWVLVVDHFTNMKHVNMTISKTSPIAWLRHGKYVFLDQGGELYGNPDVQNLFKHFNYKVCPAGTKNSGQNGPVERAHRTISDVTLLMLTGANLKPVFWPYALYHVVCISNALRTFGYTNSSPLKMATNPKEMLLLQFEVVAMVNLK